MNTYIITDPRYLLIKPEDWFGFLNLIKKEDNPTDYAAAAEQLSKLLDTEVYRLSSTGYGNWMNYITATESVHEVKNFSFAADAGLFCVLKATDRILKIINVNPLGNFAIFETDKSITRVEIDDSERDWYRMSVFSNDELLVSTDTYDFPF